MEYSHEEVCQAAKNMCEFFGLDYDNPHKPLPLKVVSILSLAYAKDIYNDDTEILKEFFNNGCQ